MSLETIKIADLPSATQVVEDDYFVVEQPDKTKKATVSQVISDLDLANKSSLTGPGGAAIIGTEDGQGVQKSLDTDRANTRELWRRALHDLGLTLVDGSFEEGAALTYTTDAIWHMSGAQCYTWSGTFPKSVPAGSTPSTTGSGWTTVGGLSLLDEVTEIKNETVEARDEAVEAKDQAEAYVLQASEIGNLYPSVTAGLAGTTNGQYFQVPQGKDSSISFRVYLNNAGSAVEVANTPGMNAVLNTIREFPSLTVAQAELAAGNISEGGSCWVVDSSNQTVANEYVNTSGSLVQTGKQIPTSKSIDDKINKRLVPGQYLPSFFPFVYEKNGNVLAWFDNSSLDVADFGPNAKEVIGTISNKYLPQGDYPVSRFPFIYDKDGKVYAWFDNGLVDSYGFGPTLQQYIKDLVGGDVVTSESSFIEGDQYKFIFKKGKIFNGQSASLNVAFTGDSWTEKNTIPKSLINILGGTYKDPGWISCSNRGDGVMSGISPVTATNFTKYDGGSNTTNPPPYGCGPDGNGYYNNSVVGSLVWTGVTVTDLSVYYYDGNGSFTVQIDTNTPVTIVGGNTGTAKKYDLTGLSAVAHKVTIQSVGDGVVSILGMYGKNSAVTSGVTVSRMGNGGAIASDYLNFSSWIVPVAQDLDLDMLFVILGTNDFRLSKGLAEYKTGLVEIITKYRQATPGICICLVSPGRCNASGTPGLDEYDQVMRELAVQYNVNFVSGYQMFPKTYDNSNGAWEDALHLSSLGAYVLTRKIKNELFQE